MDVVIWKGKSNFQRAGWLFKRIIDFRKQIPIKEQTKLGDKIYVGMIQL